MKIENSCPALYALSGLNSYLEMPLATCSCSYCNAKLKWALILMVVAGLKTTCMQLAVQSDENGLQSFP